MDIIIKTIIFAICFPVGMSLIGGLRKKLKGSRSVSDSNFVKVAKKNYVFIGSINILLFPFGAMSFFGGYMN